jgi:hypothetical protein
VLGRGVATLKYLGKKRVAIGKCRYRVWRVEDRLVMPGFSEAIFDKFYSPKLGIVLQNIKLTPNRKPISIVAFDTIEVLD